MLEAELKPLCKWVDFRDYIWSYGSFNFYGKTIVDVGADIGSSAIYFLSKSAKKVYLLENNQEYINTYYRLKESSQHPLLSHTTQITAGQLNNIHADILKMDCEGCEQHLLTEPLLKRFPEWVIGLHKPQLNSYQFELKERMLRKAGGRYMGSINADSKEGSEYIWIKKE